jgi:AraC family transcriptional regulator, exoenzyme S synthesis regulatory protein ExsA
MLEPLVPLANAMASVRGDPIARRFDIGEILFAQFSCPAEKTGIWSQTDYLLHVVSGTATWSTADGPASAGPREAVFFRKGAYLLPPHPPGELCVQTYFIPDGFVRETIAQLAAELPASALDRVPGGVIHVQPDLALSAFFHAMQVYFAADEDPPAAILKLKLKELVTSVLLSRSNRELSAYFLSLATSDAPPIPVIMEANYHHRLPLDTFAQLCHRSLSSFKRDFRKHYGTSPGKWLMDRRLGRASRLLETTQLSVTEVMFECGFEDPSHFSKAFKAKFGRSPSANRGLASSRAGWPRQPTV